jgi:hypothetical protein
MGKTIRKEKTMTERGHSCLLGFPFPEEKQMMEHEYEVMYRQEQGESPRFEFMCRNKQEGGHDCTDIHAGLGHIEDMLNGLRLLVERDDNDAFRHVILHNDQVRIPAQVWFDFLARVGIMALGQEAHAA